MGIAGRVTVLVITDECGSDALVRCVCVCVCVCVHVKEREREREREFIQHLSPNDLTHHTRGLPSPLHSVGSQGGGGELALWTGGEVGVWGACEETPHLAGLVLGPQLH